MTQWNLKKKRKITLISLAFILFTFLSCKKKRPFKITTNYIILYEDVGMIQLEKYKNIDKKIIDTTMVFSHSLVKKGDTVFFNNKKWSNHNNYSSKRLDKLKNNSEYKLYLGQGDGIIYQVYVDSIGNTAISSYRLPW